MIGPSVASLSWPRLSETLPHRKHPEVCQACGMERPMGDDDGPHAWQEHDGADQPEPIVVMLCPACAKRLIDRHPRLYRELARNEPMPGVLLLCLDCRYRDGVRCTHLDLKANGGPGLALRIAPPMTGIMCSRGRSKGHRCAPFTTWPERTRHCAGWVQISPSERE